MIMELELILIRKRHLIYNKVAAKEENKDAQKSLTLLYEYSKDTQNSIYIANYWHKKVIKNGFQKVKKNLEKLLKQQENLKVIQFI